MSSFLNKLIDRVINFIYSKDKFYERMLLLVVLFGFIIRLVAVLNVDTGADDMIYASQSANIINSNVISNPFHPPLYFYLTDFAYKFFQYTTFASRLFSLIPGTLLIILAFLIMGKFFNKKVALASAFLVAFSNFLIKMSLTEQSLLVLLFSFSAVYFGLLYLDKSDKKNLIICSVLFGLSVLTKYSGFFFLFAFLVYAFYHIKFVRKEKFDKKKIYHFITLLVIVFLFSLPFFAFNYMVYKQSKIMDFQFTEVLKPEKGLQLYSGLAGVDKPLLKTLLSSITYSNYNLVYESDLLIFVLGAIGFFLLYKKERKLFYLFLIMLIVPFILQSVGSTLSKHFVFMGFIFALSAGLTLNYISEKINKKYLFYIVLLMVLVILVINLGNDYNVPSGFFHKSGTSQLKSYINKNVKENDLIIFDQRLYTAKIFWSALPNNFLLLSQFSEFYNYDQSLDSKYPKTLTDVYFVECAQVNCGWGKIDDGLNNYTISLFKQISNQSTIKKEIFRHEFNGNELLSNDKLINEYNVYKISIPLNPELVKQTKTLNSFLFVPYMYLNMKDYLFSYPKESGINYLLDKLSFWIIIVSMILTFIAFFYIIIKILD